MEKTRLNYLDSIRGVAACVVMLHHCWLASTYNFNADIAVALSSIENVTHYSLGKLLAGHAAVLTFFVLSGFVLAYSLQKEPMSYAAFAVKRIFRIYPAFVFVILCSYALHRAIGVRHDVSSDFLRNDVINPNISYIALAKHLALWGTIDGNEINGVIWSLVHEIRISAIFPLILLSVIKYRQKAVIYYGVFSLGCTILSLCTTGRLSAGTGETTFIASLLATGFFIVFFAAGALLAIERENVALKIANSPRWKKIVFFTIVAVCLLKSGHDISNIKVITTDYICGAGAVGIIALALGIQKFRSVLNHSVPIWLGRISYSLYLVHLPILYMVNQTIGASWSDLRSSAVVIALSLFSAELMVRLVEFPSIRLGKKLSASVAGLHAKINNSGEKVGA